VYLSTTSVLNVLFETILHCVSRYTATCLRTFCVAFHYVRCRQFNISTDTERRAGISAIAELLMLKSFCLDLHIGTQTHCIDCITRSTKLLTMLSMVKHVFNGFCASRIFVTKISGKYCIFSSTNERVGSGCVIWLNMTSFDDNTKNGCYAYSIYHSGLEMNQAIGMRSTTLLAIECSLAWPDLVC